MVRDVKHTGIDTAEQLGSQPSAFEVEMDIEKLKSHNSPGIDQISAEIIKAEGIKFPLRSINLLILF
jgi:hypothetical protein